MNPLKSLFTNLRFYLFYQLIELEIYYLLFPHLENERDYGYPFDNDQELDELMEKLDLQGKANHVEALIDEMPTGYGQSFRYIMRRDLHRHLVAGNERRFQRLLRMYARFAPRCVDPKEIDPRFVATRLEV